MEFCYITSVVKDALQMVASRSPRSITVSSPRKTKLWGASDDSTFQLSDGSWVQFKDVIPCQSGQGKFWNQLFPHIWQRNLLLESILEGNDFFFRRTKKYNKKDNTRRDNAFSLLSLPTQQCSARTFTFWALSCAGFARGSTSRASCPKLEFFSGKMVEGMKTMIDNWLQDMILSDEKMDNMVHLHNTSNGGFSLHFLHEIHEFSLHCLRFDVALPEDAAPCHETIFRCLVMNLHIIPRPFVLPDSNQHHKLSTSSRRLGTA